MTSGKPSRSSTTESATVPRVVVNTRLDLSRQRLGTFSSARKPYNSAHTLLSNRSRLCKLSLFERFVLVRQLANDPLTASDSSRFVRRSGHYRKHRCLTTLDNNSAPLTTYYACKHAQLSPTLSQTYPEPGERYQALKTKLRMPNSGPFGGWLVSGGPWESFDSHGDVNDSKML